MHKFSSFALAAAWALVSLGVSAQTNPKPTATTTVTTTVSKPAATTTTVVTADATTELIALLPPSNLLAVIDAHRMVNDLLPKLAGLSVGGVDKMARELAEFTQKTGIDPSRLQAAVIGVSMQGTQASGVALVQGLDLDAKQVEAALKEFKAEYTSATYKGKTVYSLVSKVKAPDAGPVSVKTDEMAVVALGGGRLALGDLAALKKIIDAQGSAVPVAVNPALISALNEARAGALVRFALELPPELRSEAAAQGDLFKSVSTIKVLIGSLDVASDLSLSLDTILRTGAPAEATELEGGLKGLVSLVKGIFGGGGGDPKMDLIGQVIDQVKIAARANDVTLSLAVPRAVLDQLAKKPEAKTEPEKKP